MDQIKMAEEKPKSERTLPMVSIPVPLFDAMALCFYGEGPRHWEMAAAQRGFKNLKPPPEASFFPPGLKVTDTPPDWRRAREPQDGASDVPATEGQ